MPICFRVAAALLIGLTTAHGQLQAQQYPLVVATEPLTPQEEQKTFHLPPGFEIELVAAEPQIAKPLNLNFDSQGRLIVTQTIEYPYPVNTRPGRDKVMRLTDADGDGKYERVETLIDSLVIPIGVTPLGADTVYFSIPNIYRGRDSNGDGSIDRREVLYGPFGFEDTHGLNNGFTRWIDGWIYACHGFRNTSEIAGADGHGVTMNSGNTYRFRGDGSHIEQFTHGQVNPFGLCFDPLGNAYTADCHSKPMYQLLRGAFYPSFAKSHDGLGFAPTLIEHSHGSTGIGGIAYYAAEQFPPPYRDTIFIANPITHCINHDRFESHGSTNRGIEQPDFLTCDDPWFRPVDLQLGPDGALYIADFYNRVIGHYEVPLDHPGRDRQRGRIWRIVYKPDQRPLRAPNLSVATPRQLWDSLAAKNLTVRTLATNEMADRLDAAALADLRNWMAGESTATQRAHGLWVLHRRGGMDDALVDQLASDQQPLVRVHLAKMLAERASWKSPSLDISQLVVRLLGDDDAHVRRAAADALGQHPGNEQFAPLLRLWTETPGDDTHLIHVTRMALRDHLKNPGGFQFAQQQFQADQGAMKKLARVSLGVADRESAQFLFTQLLREKSAWSKHLQWTGHATRYLGKERLGTLILRLLSDRDSGNLNVLLTVSRALAQRGEPAPDSLRARAAEVALGRLSGDHQPSSMQSLELIKQLELRDTYNEVAKIANSQREINLRLAAMETCVAIRPSESIELLRPLLANPAQPIVARRKAAALLSANSSPAKRSLLIEQLKTAHFNLAVEIATGLARNKVGSELLLAEISKGNASPRLLQQRGVERALRSVDLADLDQRIAKLTAGLPPLSAEINRLIAQRKRGFYSAQRNTTTGAALFKKHCAACHQLAGQGNKVGPQLDGIGNRGIDRLLEDMLDPGRNLDPAFRSTTIETTDGQVLSGLVVGQEGQIVVLVSSDGKERRIPISSIDRRQLSPLSPMPANVPELVQGDDFYHLLGYLLSQRQKGTEEKR